MPTSTNDFGLSLLSGFAVLQVRLGLPTHLNVEFMGPPGSNIPEVEASEFPIVSYFFFYVSIEMFKASLSGSGLGEFNAGESSIRELSAATDHHRKYKVRLRFDGGALDFDCADIHRVTVGASEVSTEDQFS